MKNTRNTKQKELIYQNVMQRKDHPTADEVYDEVHKIDDKISRATVFRNLKEMADQKRIGFVQSYNGANRYDYKLTPHFHFFCDSCGELTDCEIEDDKQIQDIINNSDMHVDGYSLVFHGICNKCYKKGSNN